MPIAERSSAAHTNDAPQQETAGRNFNLHVGQLKGFPKKREGAIDDGRVETKEKSSNSGYNRDQINKEGAARLLCSFCFMIDCLRWYGHIPSQGIVMSCGMASFIRIQSWDVHQQAGELNLSSYLEPDRKGKSDAKGNYPFFRQEGRRNSLHVPMHRLNPCICFVRL